MTVIGALLSFRKRREMSPHKRASRTLGIHAKLHFPEGLLALWAGGLEVVDEAHSSIGLVSHAHD